MTEAATRPRPLLTPESQPYWQALCEHRLRIQRCPGCARFLHYPRVLCPHCFRGDLVWAEASGRGAVLTWSVVHRAQHPAFSDLVPFPIVVADMVEGFRMVANVEGIELGELRPGLPVCVRFRDLADDFTIPVFAPAERG